MSFTRFASYICFIISFCISELPSGSSDDLKFRKPKENAVLLVLCRDSDLPQLLSTLSQIENRFNIKYGYPYVFLNNRNFSSTFKSSVREAIKLSTEIKFGFIDSKSEEWSYPKHINQTLAYECRKDMERRKIQYGYKEQYHFMCRYFSGYFQDHPLVAQYEYYWRIEPHVRFMCNIDFDPFAYMKTHKKLYGYVLIHKEIMATIPSLWDTTKKFMKEYQKSSNFKFKTEILEYLLSFDRTNYNGCHFWSNFEIASFKFFRSIQYRAYFKYLDQQGGFFYERWGDAPVHSLALALFADPDEIHMFNDISYGHGKLDVCPITQYLDKSKNCTCVPNIRSQTTLSVCKVLTTLFND